MKHLILSLALLGIGQPCFCWGFFAHRSINYHAVFLLPPGMIGFYKSNIAWLTDHAVDPDKRRYMIPEEAPRHFLDLDRYGAAPWPDLPHRWDEAVARYGQDTLMRHGIAPWWLPRMVSRLTEAFRTRDQSRILKLSAEIGHYVGDIHVPLHASRNHNGQLTGQEGIHAFWESRLPELFAEQDYDFLIGHAQYIPSVSSWAWDRIMESGRAADTVLRLERELSASTRPSQRFAFEQRNGKWVRQYAEPYATRYQDLLRGMVERRMRMSILGAASCWYTAWVNAGQPDLPMGRVPLSGAYDSLLSARLDSLWRNAVPQGRACPN